MNPEEQKPKIDDEKLTIPENPDAPAPVVHPWQDSQDQPVVHVTAPQLPEIEEPQGHRLTPEPKPTFGQRLKKTFRSRKFWLIVVALLIVSAASVWFIQPSRWWAVNLFGARNTLTITTVSPGEGKAKLSQLRNVEVIVNGQTYRTDSKGELKVPDVPYGKVSIKATKTGFQTVDYGVTLDFDPFLGKLGGSSTDAAARDIALSMRGVGVPVSFKVVNWLSGQPVSAGEFAIDDVVAKPNDEGLVSLKIPGTDAQKVTVSASFGGAFVDKKFDVMLGSDDTPEIKVVPGGKHYFLSRSSGVLTLYSSNLDGSNVETVVTGSGKETDATNFAVSPDGKYGVLSSSREGAYSSHHDLLQKVYVVDLGTKKLTKLDEGVKVTFADWSGQELIYTTTAYDASTNSFTTTLRGVDVGAQRVYNFETADSIVVSTVAAGKIAYFRYTTSGPDAASSPVLREAPANATTSTTLGDQVSFDSYLQTSFDHILFKTAQDQAWHDYNFSTGDLKSIAVPATGNNTAVYVSTASADGKKRAMVDRVDGQFTLFVDNATTGKRTTIYGDDGLSGPIRWVSDTILTYRVSNNAETADYVVSVDGGKPQKITDITATGQESDSPRFDVQ